MPDRSRRETLAADERAPEALPFAGGDLADDRLGSYRPRVLLVDDQPEWIQRYWSRNHGLFARNLYRTGLLGRLFASLRMVSGIDEKYLRAMARLHALLEGQRDDLP